MKKHKKKQKFWPWWKMAITDILVISCALLIFALFHHVIPSEQEPEGITTSRRTMQTMEPTTAEPTQTVEATKVPEPSQTPESTLQPDETDREDTILPAADTQALETEEIADEGTTEEMTEETEEIETLADEDPDELPEAGETDQPGAYETPEPEPVVTLEPVIMDVPLDEPVGYFGTKYADRFTDGEVISENGTYRSENLNITVTPYDVDGIEYYVADIYVRDISCLKVGFAKDKYGRNYSEWPAAIAERNGAVVTVNGDYYGVRSAGIVIRNGTLYRSSNNSDMDICVLYWDGTMETYSAGHYNAEELLNAGAYQVWCFGPKLLDNQGQPMTKFNSNVNPSNPRTVIGYYEPGHYCFVVVDGRSKYSNGISLIKLSKLMNTLGCTRAYNLDGGQTSQMVCGTKVVNNPYKNGRKCSDVIMILDAVDMEE